MEYCDTIRNMDQKIAPDVDIVATYSDAPHRRLVDLRTDGLAEVSQFGRLSYAKARPDLPLHRHFGILEVHYLERGEQYWQLGDQTYHMEGGDLFVTMPDEIHSTGGQPVAPGIMYWFGLKLPPERKGMLGLTGKESWEIIRRLLALPCRHFRATSRIKPLLAEILQLHYSSEAFMRTVCMRHLMIRLLLEIIKAAEAHSGPRVSERMVGIRRMIQNNPGQKYQLRDLAWQTHLSLSRFKSRFKEEMGMSPWLFIVETRIEAAKKKLFSGNEPITRIAAQLGFASSQHFATVFKRITGVTPKAYRKGIFPHGPSHRSDDGQY
jgi:AraC-like DNA-binding protein